MNEHFIMFYLISFKYYQIENSSYEPFKKWNVFLEKILHLWFPVLFNKFK